MSRGRNIGRAAACMFFVGSGMLHFVLPGAYLKIMPPYVPWPLQMVYLTGAAEVAGGLGLLVSSLRRAVAWGLVLLLVAVFPANFYMAQNNIQVGAHAIPQWLLWARLPVQGLLVWWVLWRRRT